MSQQALLFDGSRLRIGLHDDDSAEFLSKLPGNLVPYRLPCIVPESDAPIRLWGNEEDPPPIFRHLHVVVNSPSFGVYADSRPQVDLILLKAIRPNFPPPSQKVRLPLLQSSLKLAILVKVNIVGDFLIKQHISLLTCKRKATALWADVYLRPRSS
jgi:hypothetical protein